MGSRKHLHSDPRSRAKTRLPLGCSSLATLVLLSLLCGSSASATRIEFPDAPILSASTSHRLSHGSGEEYLLELAGWQEEPSWSNSKGDKIRFDFQVSFADGGTIDSEFMVVFTSLRVGSATMASCSDLAPGGALPFGDFEYVANSATGDIVRHSSPTDSTVFGESRVCNAEDARSPFFGIVFAPDSDKPLTFSLEIATTVDDVPLGSQLRFMKQGYGAAVPESSTGLLVLAGLVGLAVRSRSPGRRATTQGSQTTVT